MSRELMRSIHGISIEAALLTDRLNKKLYYEQHKDDFKEFLTVDLADLLYYVNALRTELGVTAEELQEISDAKLFHFYGVNSSNLPKEKLDALLEKHSSIFSKYKHAKPY